MALLLLAACTHNLRDYVGVSTSSYGEGSAMLVEGIFSRFVFAIDVGFSIIWLSSILVVTWTFSFIDSISVVSAMGNRIIVECEGLLVNSLKRK